MSVPLLDRIALATAIICLGVLGLRPAFTRMVDPTIAVVRSEGATAAEARAVSDSLGSAPVIDLTRGEPLGSATQLEVVGWGLDTGELRRAGDRAIVLHSRPLPEGIRSVDWTGAISLGDPVQIRTTVQSGHDRTITLFDESGPVDSAAITGNAPAAVTLHHTPRATGAVRYVLRFGTELDTFSVNVSPVRPTPALIIASAPSRDQSDLRDWFAAQGGSVLLRTTVSRDRSRVERVNLSDASSSSLDAALLDRVAVVITDGRTLTHLSVRERAALRAAIDRGLGLIVLIDDAGREARLFPLADREAFLPWRTEQVADLEERLVRPRSGGVVLSSTPVTAQPLLLTGTPFGGSAILDDGQGGVLAASAPQGAGRVAATVVTGAARWLRGGETRPFARYWSTLVGAVARPDPAVVRWVHSGGPILIDRPVELGRWGPPAVSVDAGGDTLRLAADPLMPGRGVVTWWPRVAGWNAIGGMRLWVSGRENWTAWRGMERRRVTTEWIDAHRAERPDGGRLPRRVPWPLWPFFLGFVLAAGRLWRVQR